MIECAISELARAGIEEPIRTVLADGGYWNTTQIAATRARQIEVLVPAKNRQRPQPRKNAPPQSDEAQRIEAILDTRDGQARYRRRQQIVEPVFANIKYLRRIDRFQRRGLRACQAEWKLIAATHNLLKLWRATQTQHSPNTAAQHPANPERLAETNLRLRDKPRGGFVQQPLTGVF
jgi:hypothetical protein